MTWESEVREVGAGAFAYVQAGGGLCIANAGIIAGTDETAVVDALFTPAMTRSLLAAARRVSPPPVGRLIDTHHHVDHTLGNACFPEATTIIAHERARAEMERVGLGVLALILRIAPSFEPELVGAAERLPDETFGGAACELDVSGRRVRLLHYGTAHTRGDVLVHLPEERVLFTGDVGFFGVTPLGFEGHIGNWLAIGRRVIEEIDADVLVPGHGPVGTKDDLRRMLGYLRLVRDGARTAFDAGAPEEDAVRSVDLGEYRVWAEPERLSLNVARCYQEFRGEIAP